MNFLELAPEQRPDLPTRERFPGSIEVQCPACGQWRPGFTVAELSTEDAALRGVSWACDGDRTRWAREA